MKMYKIKTAMGVLQIVCDKKITSCDFVDMKTTVTNSSIPSFILRAINEFKKGNMISGDFLNKHIDLNGTDFQKRVWSAVVAIPFGETRTYGEIAQIIGRPRAARAVGSACGANKIALFIPCHRVVGKNSLHINYRWGKDIKEKLLSFEKRVW